MIDKTVIAIFSLFLVVSAAVAIDSFFVEYIESWGNIVEEGAALNLYEDFNREKRASKVNWGSLSKNTFTIHRLYAWNNSTESIKLELDTGNYRPLEAEKYLELTWNCSGYILDISEKICVELEMYVFNNASNISFSFDIIIRGVTI